MCGILGLWTETGVAGAPFRAALDLMSHRGPDDEGYLAAGSVAATQYRGDSSASEVWDLPHIDVAPEATFMMGQRRLSIIDTSFHGRQPFSDPSGRYHLVYNGELFNYVELRNELRARGRTFETASDTEVVLSALMEWGGDAFSRFNGMWALALWDDRDKTVMLSRDRFGIKPLFYAQTPGLLAFGSTTRTVRRLSGSGATPNTASVERYLDACLLNDTVATFWTGVDELEPGTFAIFDGKVLRSERYWRFEPNAMRVDGRDAVAMFAELFEDSLRLRMRSDVPVGTLLSGGLDSSTIVCALHELGLVRPGMFESFSAVFDDDRFSERAYAEEVVERAKLKPHWVYPDVEAVTEHLDDLFFHIEQPFRSLAVFSQNQLYRAVKDESDIKVLLNGQGADELFGGYTRHYYVMFGHLIARGRIGRAVTEMRRFSVARGVPLARVLRNTLGHVKAAAGRPDYFNETTFREVTGSALREYLAYDDRNSMAASVEARVPFMDYRLVEYAFSLPADEKIHDFSNKRVERVYAESIVPARIVDRSDKMGFVSPQEIWQRNELAAPLRCSRDALSEWIRSGVLSGRDDLLSRMDRYLDDPASSDWAFAWRVYCLDRWTQYERVSL